MENASKALIMAGGVLIGILILSLAVYLFIDFGGKAERIHDQITSNQLTQFNAQFNVYETRKDVTIYQIISLVNLAKENNDKYKDDGTFADSYKIEIVLGVKDLASDIVTEEEKLKYITDNNDVEKKTDANNEVSVEAKVKYECTKVEYHSNRKSFKSCF